MVCKGGRFEEVIVSSREISASSMQLVMASRVKADPSSKALTNVNSAAKSISALTGNLVATAENCRDKVSAGTPLSLVKSITSIPFTSLFDSCENRIGLCEIKLDHNENKRTNSIFKDQFYFQGTFLFSRTNSIFTRIK